MNCDKCKRQLQGTVHTKDDYRVDTYRLWTGDTSPIVFKEEGEEEIRFLKIERPKIVTLCNVCVVDPKLAGSLKKFDSPL